jgi:hypothetical protein
MSDYIPVDCVNLICALAPILLDLDQEDPIPYHNSVLTGQMRFEEVMNTQNPKRFSDCCRMDKRTFTLMLYFLIDHGELVGSENICAGQRLMIYISILKGSSNRTTSEMWQHSGSTISEIVNEVAMCFDRVQHLLFIRPTNERPQEITNNPKFAGFFDDCIGALDGCHCSAATNDPLFRNYKHNMFSQNVLGLVNFDLTFSHVLAGWEGCAHDGAVLADALAKGLTTFPGKYYLGDAGYGLSRYCLTPYRGVRYHLKEWEAAGRRPENARELFNLRHASLRNIIERAFGILKKRFPILVRMTSYPMETQVRLVKSCFMIHNFIRLNQGYEDDYDQWVQDEDGEDDDDDGDNDDGAGGVNGNMYAFRNNIAQQMWVQYQQYIGANA